MKISSVLIIIFAILCIAGLCYLILTEYDDGEGLRETIKHLTSGLRCTNDSLCALSEICSDGRCLNVCSKQKCGVNEVCRVLIHEYLCECLSGYERNFSTNICDIKLCDADEDCRRNEECDEFGTCQCKPDYFWDPDFISCMKQNVTLEAEDGNI